jgi:hypothetical protein
MHILDILDSAFFRTLITFLLMFILIVAEISGDVTNRKLNRLSRFIKICSLPVIFIFIFTIVENILSIILMFNIS